MAAISPNPADTPPHGSHAAHAAHGAHGSLLGLFPFSGKAEFRDAVEYERVIKRRKQTGKPVHEGWMGLALSCDGVHFSSVLKLAR